MSKLKKRTYKEAIAFGIYYLGIVIFLAVSRNELDMSDIDKIGEAIVIAVGGTTALPIGGALLILYGVHLVLRKGYEGVLPAELVGVVCSLIVGPGITVGYAINIFSESILLPAIIQGVLVLTLVLPIAFLTLILHGGTKLVKKDGVGIWLTKWRSKFNGHIYENEDTQE